MSTTYEIVKFAKPTKKELLAVDKFIAYDSFRIEDEDGYDAGWGIYLFRADDKSVSNLLNSRFAVKIVLPEIVTNYEKLYMDISDGVNTEQINMSILRDYKSEVQTSCIAIKIKSLWSSGDNYIYGLDKENIIKNMPGIDVYNYVPVKNSMLAKAEIPFLIFQKNYGKCFIEMY